MSNIIKKIAKLTPETFAPEKTEDQLNKLINIKTVAQFKHLNLTDADVAEIHSLLRNIEFKLKANDAIISRVVSMKPETIALSFGDSFI